VYFVVKVGLPMWNHSLRQEKQHRPHYHGALGKSEQDRLVHGSTVANVSRYAHCHVMAVRNPAKQFIWLEPFTKSNLCVGGMNNGKEDTRCG